MGKIRTDIKGMYKLERHELYMTIHYALRYEEYKKEYKSLTDTAKGIRYDTDKVSTSIDSDPTFILAERRADIGKKISNIEGAARSAGGEVLYPFLLRAVTQEGASFELLRDRYGMPVGKNLFYVLKRKFYYILAKKI
jgi:hypothetical protein